MTALAVVAASGLTAPAPSAALADALRLAADLVGRVAAADPSIDLSVSVHYSNVEKRPAVGFLAHGSDEQELASVTACAFLLAVPVTVSDLDDSTGRVWVGGVTVRANTTVTLRTLLTDPDVIASARQALPAGTGGW
ncbi:hypothetical protein [Candidatus Frankia nodulisporulans]|uniref:hypothetical protein n=1 Tax=Candidatus Frankia nodulisporulans TaxID=2060052 RepID=UPI0013D287BB|nr:hypothetical protein [Candidatus Frankia nodulisporulans]